MSSQGYSLIEVLVAITVMVIAAGAAIPFAFGSVDRSRAGAAASYVAGRIAMARFEAVKRSTFVAIRFVEREDGYWLRAYADGNGDGVSSRDISRNIDLPISSDERLDYQFPGVTFGIQPGVTSLDPGQLLDASDPIQIGASTLLSFSPAGSSTSGTLFIRGQRASQFAVRVLGVTGRTRTFQFNVVAGRWQRR